MTDRVPGLRRAPPLRLLAAGVGALAVVGLLADAIRFRSNRPFGFESEWMAMIVAHRSPGATVVALVFNYAGGGQFASLLLPLAIATVLIARGRRWSALYVVVASVAAGQLVHLLKALVARPRPTDILVHPDFGSFPSGHSANAAVLALSLGMVLWRTSVWVLGAGYTVAMMFSRTYLGAHWISDTIAGALLASTVALLVLVPFQSRLARERPHPPAGISAKN